MTYSYRFYFVGDEDLLEIIGNSKNVPRLQKHFKKMFAGIHQVLLDDEQTQVVGIASKEGEEVSFVVYILLNHHSVQCCFTRFMKVGHFPHEG